MNMLAKFACVMGLALVTTASAAAETAAFVNRRDQARQAFLATPEGIYDHYCAHCHGDDGLGAGRLWSFELSPGASDLTASRLDESELLRFIDGGSARYGRSALCPPWGLTISPANLERLARHLVSLRTPAPVVAKPAERAPGEIGALFPWRMFALILAEFAVIAVIIRRWQIRATQPEGKL
ncbi:MAG: cytochrome c [Gammaproteobacteria bacterium]|nr:cytochrome c [Gammaproteobacteria bacterium]